MVNTIMKEPLNPRALRDAFGTFATGVTVVTAWKPSGEPVGVTANSFTSVSLDPPLVLWCLNTASPSASAFTEGLPFAVTILGESGHATALHFAGKSPEKFPKGAEPADRSAAPKVGGAHPCRLDCVTDAVYPAGDHLVILGRVVGMDRKGGKPLAFHEGRFRRLAAEAVAQTVDSWERVGVDPPRLLALPFD